jgi:hypothetical protein
VFGLLCRNERVIGSAEARLHAHTLVLVSRGVHAVGVARSVGAGALVVVLVVAVAAAAAAADGSRFVIAMFGLGPALILVVTRSQCT